VRPIFTLAAALCCITLLSSSCAHTQPTKHIEGYSFSTGDKAGDTALTMVGRPYKYKGDSPAGFDCSGLVRYSYLAAGMDVPHGTKTLRSVTRSISYREIRKGDLLFFLQEGKKYSHVGIYVDDNRFVHAPSTGKTVRMDSLLDPYWKKHFLDARRF
jgi:cell wall-associated NlpC family hydrolase